MIRKSIYTYILAILIISSFAIKVNLIYKYGNLLTLDSDDLNYIKSAVVFLKEGIFTYQNYNEPTVFIMPLFPIFLSVIFKIFGYDLLGLQLVRLIQAVFSIVTIIIVFLIARKLVDIRAAIISAFLVSFYLPNIITVGYIMTETMFTMLLYILIYLSIKYSEKHSAIGYAIIGLTWALATLCRPTISLYPVLLFIYSYFKKNQPLRNLIKTFTIMALIFAVIMLPWWVRNYIEYGDFIPLAASSGNPMLQGTYINYDKTPENTVLYKLGKNAYETNKIEVEVAKNRIKTEFKRDFWRYLKWYTVEKVYLFWGTIFYWKQFHNINQYYVLAYHYVLLLGFIGMILCLISDIRKHLLTTIFVLYYTAIHCVYMAFDRYAFPVVPILSVYCGYFLIYIFDVYKRSFLIQITNFKP